MTTKDRIAQIRERILDKRAAPHDILESDISFLLSYITDLQIQNNSMAKQLIALLVMDLGYKDKPWHGHDAIRHQFAYDYAQEVLGDKTQEEISKAIEQVGEEKQYAPSMFQRVTELESVLREARGAMKEPLEFQGTMRGEKHNSVLRMKAVLTKLEKTLGEGK